MRLSLLTSFPLHPGLEVSGEIVELGAGCAPRLAIGDQVWGTFPWDFDAVKGPFNRVGTVN